MSKFALSSWCVAVVLTGAVAVFGCGVASADSYTGEKYSDAKAELAKSNEKAVIATKSGDQLAEDDCVVTDSQKAPWVKGDNFAPVTDTVLVSLNCDAGVASATKSGNSAASPEGRKAQKEADKAATDTTASTGG